MKTPKEFLIEEIKAYEWDDEQKVIDAILPNIIFEVAAQESTLALLDSRFGGTPAVPEGFLWPRISLQQKDRMAFFFQLNFKDIAVHDLNSTLPKDGILLCFAAVTDDIMWEPEAKNAFKIYYFPDTSDLQLATLPDASELPQEQQLAPRNITFTTSFQLPLYPFNYDGLEANELSEDDADGINDIAEEMHNDAIIKRWQAQEAKATGLKGPTLTGLHALFSHNQLLGVPVSKQHCIAEEWAELHHGDEDERERYVNLISFEMRGEYGYGFSTNGAHLYLCMDKDELQEKNFKQVKAIIQNS